jgi:ABC-type nitrate/sulfonate/bicarbonate transport system substrate-binding protein
VYRRTGLYPITDVMVVSPHLAQSQTQLLPKLVAAFAEANGLSSEHRDQEEQQLAQREIQLLGEDPHQYGLGENQRKNIGAFTDFLYRMGAMERSLAPEELFVPSTLSA